MAVSPSFFPAFRTELLSGRAFNSSDTATAPAVAVVTSDFATRFFAEADIIGRRIRLDDPEKPMLPHAQR